ncbi:MAG: hypothetical protein EoVTN8_1176 [Fluviibacter phosphoraccumulans EoVTN8]
MNTQQNKTTTRRSSAMSGSLAYYNLLAGINVARRSDQTQRITAEVTQASRNESAKS